jgi:hypothetical protein
MTLFDASVYGEPTPKRKRKERPDEVRLGLPWHLLGHHGGPPMAHLLSIGMSKTKDGSLRTRCERYGYEIPVDGHPMARVCSTCWDLNR